MDSHKRKGNKNVESSVKTEPSENPHTLSERSRMVKGGSNSNSNKKTANTSTPILSLRKPKESPVPVTLRQAAGMCCGEMFVTNNARRWTFFCTFCNKSTRDIGEFICHIKNKHLPHSSHCNDDDDYNRIDDATENEQSMNYDTSYLDYGNFLDVNVHTESEDLTFNGQEKRQASKTNNLRSTPQPSNERQIPNPLKRQRITETSTTSNATPVSTTERIDKTATPTSSTRIKTMPDSNSNDSFKAYENKDDGDDELILPLKNEQNNHDDDGVDDEDDEEEEDQDYDNKLLIALADSLDNMAYDGSSEKVKEKRRQIRGTAYCELCDKTFQYYSLYRNHMIKHSNETPFKCTICHKGFKSKQAIRYHINTHTNKKMYKCGICSASYNVENHFITHVLSHENSTTFPCIVCGKILRSENERYQHLTEHTEERPYRCEFCNKLFRLRHHLSNHLKLHRQYRCDYCKCDFTSSIQLRKPYTCTTCQKDKSIHKKNTTNESRGSVHPLELYDSEQLTQPPIECVNVSEIITDSEVEDMKDNQDTDDEEPEEEEDGDDGDEGDDGDDGGNDNEEKIYGQHDVNDDDDDDDDDDAADDKEDDDYYTPTSGAGKRYTCRECGRTYAALSGLNFHIKQKHSI